MRAPAMNFFCSHWILHLLKHLFRLNGSPDRSLAPNWRVWKGHRSTGSTHGPPQTLNRSQTMNTNTLAVVGAALVLSAVFSQADPLGTAFTYQGRLNDGGQPANGVYNLQFVVYASQVSGPPLGPALTNSVSVTNGLFTTTLDFGPGVFIGDARWLEISARTNGGSTFTLLAPRQPLTPAPYALAAVQATGPIADSQLSANIARLNADQTFSGTVSASSFSGSGSGLTSLPAASLVGTVPNSGLSGSYSSPVTFSSIANNMSGAFQGSFSGNGSLVTNIIASNIFNLGGSAWVIGGNTNYASAGILGTLATTNHSVLQMISDGVTALRLDHTAGVAPFVPSVVGGDVNNSGSVVGGFIGGGGGGTPQSANSLSAIFTVIGGGTHNQISGEHSVIVGGGTNWIETQAAWDFIGGGSSNLIEPSQLYSVIVGGYFNDQNGNYSAIGGGANNSIYTNVNYCTIPGGCSNVVAASYGLAAGNRAKANHQGSFVWADSSMFDYASANPNTFNVRCVGGAQFVSGINGGNGATTAGVQLAPGGNSWSGLSDRNAKENFETVNYQEILERLDAVPITTWNLKSQPVSIRHVGPMAQDFAAAFRVGEDDRHITTSDADGVALAAIKGLNQKLEKELGGVRAENAQLKHRLERLEQLINAKNGVVQ